MDAASYTVLARCLDGLTLARDLAGGLDVVVEGLLATVAALPGPRQLAVVLDDEGGRPCIRASRGQPDLGLILSAALGREATPGRPRILRRGADPVLAEPDGSVALPRQEAAMLAAPIVVNGVVTGAFFADTLLGPEVSLTEDLRLAGLVAGLIGRAMAMAGESLATRAEMVREVSFLRSKVSLRYRHVFSSGASDALEGLRAETERAALVDAPMLLVGEDGCGRGVLARLIHELSPRGTRPFLLVADPLEPGLAARLFGTTANGNTPGGPGLLEEADGGSLLFTDAHLLPPDSVTRLVHYLRTGTFTRQGTDRERRADTRLFFKTPPQGPSPELAAVRSLRRLVVPSLRERREDIPALLEFFLGVGEQRAGRRLGLTHKAQKALEAYDWPGNIREMEAVAARLSLAATGERIDIADIPPEILAEGERPAVLPEDAAELRDMERQQVVSALERHGWVQSRAARELGLTLRQIGYRIRKYGLARDEDLPDDGTKD